MSYRKEQHFSLDHSKNASKELGVDFSIYSLKELKKLIEKINKGLKKEICGYS